MPNIRVMHFGLGPIGAAILKQLSGRTGFKVVGGVDVGPAKVAVLSTGVNPGIVMDALPIALTAVCARVDRIVVNRIQDARARRLPFQQKIGAGMTTEQFQRQVADGSVRHVGFTESIAMIADALGWTLDRITDNVD